MDFGDFLSGTFQTAHAYLSKRLDVDVERRLANIYSAGQFAPQVPAAQAPASGLGGLLPLLLIGGVALLLLRD